MLRKTGWILYAVILLFFWTMMLRITIPYLSFKPNVDFLRTKQGVIHLAHWRVAFYVHVVSSILVLLLGIFQFLPGVLRKMPAWHRSAGKVYVALVIGISGPGGLVMAFYANGGWPARISFILTAFLWMLFTGMAFIKVRSREFEKHEAFMIRSFALTLSAITLRCYAFILPSIIILHPREEYTLIAWLSWIPNLLLAEWIIRKKKKPAPAIS
jgi:hypothetical protein